MIGLLLSVLASATAAPPAAPSNLVQDARHAIAVGRLKEARLVISRAVASGASGPIVERLLADLAFQSGKFDEAASRVQHLAASNHRDAHVCEAGGLAALHLGRWDAAKTLVECATAFPQSSWRTWNARGVIADHEADWATADQSYGHAHELAPEESEILNNQGWSRLLRGDWAGALPYLQEAARLDPGDSRIANNLELTKAALATDLPTRGAEETDEEWAYRLNDAGVAAELSGDRGRAIAAFTRALRASGAWYERASNNLETLSKN